MTRLILSLVLAAGVYGQGPGDPFTLLRIVRKSAGPVVDSSHIDAHRRARVAVDVLGLKSITGNSQVWLVEAHGSFASIEAVDSALVETASQRDDEREMLAPTTTLVALYRPGLSYRPEEAVKLLPSARYFQVTIYRSRPGTWQDFAELIQLRKLALDSVNVDRPELGYQILSGATAGTYLFLAPLPSLRAIDNGIARTPVYAEGVSQAASKARREITLEADVTREHFLFRVDPRISFVSEAFAAPNPAFWHGPPGQVR